MEEIVQVISQVGFPIAVATYLLIRLEPTIKENTAINNKILERLEIQNKSSNEVTTKLLEMLNN